MLNRNFTSPCPLGSITCSSPVHALSGRFSNSNKKLKKKDTSKACPYVSTAYLYWTRVEDGYARGGGGGGGVLPRPRKSYDICFNESTALDRQNRAEIY